MLALGLTLVVSVAAAPPAVTSERLASTYDEAACDPADGGECAEEVLLDLNLLAPSPAILDCESPFIVDMIGKCDLPAPALPTLHVPTLRNGAPGFTSSSSSPTSDRLSVVASASSVDGAMPGANGSLHPAPCTARLSFFDATRTQMFPPPRLNRPPRV